MKDLRKSCKELLPKTEPKSQEEGILVTLLAEVITEQEAQENIKGEEVVRNGEAVIGVMGNGLAVSVVRGEKEEEKEDERGEDAMKAVKDDLLEDLATIEIIADEYLVEGAEALLIFKIF